MSSRWWGREYGFATSFTLEAPLERVHDVLLDLEHYSAWWPQVRAVAKVDDDTALVVCRSALPYDLELVLTAVSRDPGHLEVGIDGPIAGWARFRLYDEGAGRTRVLFDQQVRSEARAFIVASYLVKPLLVWNHHRMMEGLVAGVTTRVRPDQSRAASAAS